MLFFLVTIAVLFEWEKLRVIYKTQNNFEELNYTWKFPGEISCESNSLILQWQFLWVKLTGVCLSCNIQWWTVWPMCAARSLQSRVKELSLGLGLPTSSPVYSQLCLLSTLKNCVYTTAKRSWNTQQECSNLTCLKLLLC